MKVALLSAVLALTVTAAVAQPRPSTLRMTCGQARATVASLGAVVLSTGPTTYDRYVASRAFCMFNERTEAAWAPTRDTPQCVIGYRCVEADYWWD